MFVAFISIDNPKSWSQWHSASTDTVFYTPFFETKKAVEDLIQSVRKEFPENNLDNPCNYQWFIQYVILEFDETDKKGFSTLCHMMRAYNEYKKDVL